MAIVLFNEAQRVNVTPFVIKKTVCMHGLLADCFLLFYFRILTVVPSLYFTMLTPLLNAFVRIPPSV